MKNLPLILAIIFAFMVCLIFGQGCTIGGKQLVLQDVIEPLDIAVDQLAADWPKASGFIRGNIGENSLTKDILDTMDKVDSWFKDADGEWLDDDELANLQLNTFQRWYITGVRLGHTAPLLRALIQIHAPGLMVFPEVANALAFLGLGI